MIPDPQHCPASVTTLIHLIHGTGVKNQHIVALTSQLEVINGVQFFLLTL